MSDVLIVGPDEFDITARFRETDISAIHLDGVPVGADLDDAGIEEAKVVLLTHVDHASLIPVAKERNPDIQIVLYTSARLPPFASRQADVAIDQALVEVEEVIDAVADRVRDGRASKGFS